MDAAAIITAIDAAYAAEDRGEPRTYIGASVIGSPCDAYLAFSLRGFPDDPPEPRLRRIFALGNHIEDVVIKDLRRAGLTVFAIDALTGKQFSHEALGGHIKGNMDGQVIFGDEVVGLEIKSMNARLFAKFKAEGVRSSHPHYYAQMQFYMGMGGYHRFLFVAYCKDNSEYHCEFVNADELDWLQTKYRIETVLANEARKVGKDESDWRCRDCFKAGACWHDKPVARACRTCGHAAAIDHGQWHCRKHDKTATDPCDDWVRYEPLKRT